MLVVLHMMNVFMRMAMGLIAIMVIAMGMARVMMIMRFGCARAVEIHDSFRVEFLAYCQT